MINETIDRHGDQVAKNQGPTLHVFVAFEDLNTRMEAWQLYRHLAEDLARDLDMTSAFCNFDVLGSGDTDDETMKAACEADLVLFSMNSGFRLTSEIRSWIESWIPRKQNGGGGLFLLIEYSAEPEENNSSTRPYLQDAAFRAGMDFLAQSVKSPTPRLSIPAGSPPVRMMTGSVSGDGGRLSGFNLERVS